MLIGVPKEIKNHEYRIGLTPAGARELTHHGHQVIVQRDGGKAIGLTNEMYEKAGATIVETEDGFYLSGVQKLTGAQVFGHDDHRISMSLVVAGLAEVVAEAVVEAVPHS